MRAFEAGVSAVLSIGIGEQAGGMGRALDICRQFNGQAGVPKLYASAGVYPHNTHELNEEVLGKLDSLLPGNVTALERQLDVVLLHEIVLHRILGISPEAVREQRNVRYYRSAEEAVQQVKSGANAAFLLNPVPLTVMRDICYAGRVMPQKSTDFYPKLLSGLTLDNLDQCF